MAAKKLPGTGWTYMAYDDADRIVLSQDREMYAKGESVFYAYDVMGRECVMGIHHENVSTVLANTGVSGMSLCRFTGTGDMMGYNLTGMELTNPEVLKAQFYDFHSFIGGNTILEYSPIAQYDPPGGSSRGFLTGVATARLSPTGAGDIDTIAYYYDMQGRVVQSRETNVKGGHDMTTYSLGLNGEVVAKRHDHTAPGRPIFTEVTSYAYDEWGRLTQTTHNINGSTPVTLASYAYDEVGRLASKTVGGEETTNYRYNVRSWPIEADGPRFTERLLYNQNTDSLWPNREHEYRWDGKVAAYGIKAGGEVEMRGFRLFYDNLGRLTEAHYGEGPALDRNYLDYDEKVGYDDMGNPLWITRRGQYGNGHCTTIDDITLTYDGNKVMKTSDNGYTPTWSGAFDFVDMEDESVEYEYDQNGNMTKDLDRDIAEIEYNLLNLPTMIRYQNGSRVSYIYAATGEKLRVDHGINVAPVLDPAAQTAQPASIRGGMPPVDPTPADSTFVNYVDKTRVDYCGNMIYDRGVRRLLTDEGYVTFASDGTPQYHYYLRDHLGSIRVVMAQDGTVEQKTHYYPFGGIMYGSTGQGVQPYKYGGKELDRANGLDAYDFGARMYFANRAQWMTMDPLCEKYYDISPYAYCANNPVRYIDPDGEKILFVNGYWASGWIGNLIGSDQCGKGYWGAGFDKAAQSFFKDWTPINSTNYIDGSSLFGGDMSGQDRYVAGYFFAKQHLDELTSNMSPNEGFNMVTHSEGAAYGAGVAQYLISQGYSVNTILHLSADEGDEFDTPKEPYTIQLSYDRDWVTNNHIMKSTDRYGIIDRGNLKGFYVHGATKSRYIFKAAEDLLSVKIEQTIGELNGRVYTGEQQVAGSTRYNTIFKNVNGHILDIHR